MCVSDTADFDKDSSKFSMLHTNYMARGQGEQLDQGMKIATRRLRGMSELDRFIQDETKSLRGAQKQQTMLALRRVYTHMASEAITAQERWEKHLPRLLADIDHNWPSQAFSPSLAASSKLVNSFTSRIGFLNAFVARRMATLRYGEKSVPSILLSSSLSTTDKYDRKDTGPDTVIVTRFNRQALETGVDSLVAALQEGTHGKIGDQRFHAFAKTVLEDLRQKPLGDMWTQPVDLYISHARLGLLELKSGGNMDTANTPGQLRKLFRAYLAFGNANTPMGVSCAYANQGTDNNLAGGLPHHVITPPTSSGGLWVDRAWWEMILPRPVTYEQLRYMHDLVGRSYPLRVPGRLRG